MKKNKWFISTVLKMAGVVVFAVLLRHYVFKPVEVIGISMEPNYHEHDRLWQTSLKAPGRFDVITFSSPRNDKRLVKRVVGLPGETVAYQDDQLYIDGKVVVEPYLTELREKWQGDESLTEDFTYEGVIPEDMYFVLGDNRQVADDSRYFGLVAKERIEGVVFFRFYPFDHLGMP